MSTVCMYHSLFNKYLMDGHFGCFHYFLVTINDLVYLYFHIIRGVSSGKKSWTWDHWVKCKTYVVTLDIAQLHLLRTVPISFPTSNLCKCLCTHNLAKLLLFFLILTNLISESWHLSLILTCISHFSWMK